MQEFVDVETAKKSGRKNFTEMLRFLKKNPHIQTVVAEKTDRLYRNFKDYVILDDLELTVHLYKENVLLSPKSNSHEKMMHGLKVLMAKNYLDNLSEEVKKGMTEKARQGLYPSQAPIGYLNDGVKRTLVVDQERAPIIAKLFELYAHGNASITDLHKYAVEIGLTYPPPYSGKPVARCTIARVLKNPLYAGTIRWSGHEYESKHECLISRETFDLVQAKMENRVLGVAKTRKFAFVGLLTCGHCGCGVTAEIKKERYVYYHCTGFKGKCPEKFIREEALEEKLDHLVRGVQLPENILDWLIRALQESHKEEQKFHEEAIGPLKVKEAKLEQRLSKLYEDKLDGVISEAFWLVKQTEYQEDLEKTRQLIRAHQQADARSMEFGVKTLELARTLYSRYSSQNTEEKRKLLDLVLSNCVLKGGQLTPEYRQPFELLASAASVTGKGERLDLADPASLDFWRPRRDSNSRHSP